MTHQTMTAEAAAATETGSFARNLQTVFHYSLGAVVALSTLAGVSRLLDTGLPGCSSARIDRTLKTIARTNGMEGATLTAKREIAKGASEVQCQVTATAANGSRFEISYRIFRNDAGRVRVGANWRAA